MARQVKTRKETGMGRIEGGIERGGHEGAGAGRGDEHGEEPGEERAGVALLPLRLLPHAHERGPELEEPGEVEREDEEDHDHHEDEDGIL